MRVKFNVYSKKYEKQIEPDKLREKKNAQILVWN